jgi:MGT family glycosyltransferase
MARILAYTSPARGHLFPLTPIIGELHRRGHEIALRTLASEVEQMRSLGLEVSPINERVEVSEHDDWRARNPRHALELAVDTFCARAEFDGPDLSRAIADERPDALIIDINCWGALATAELWGGPYATFCPYPLPLSSRETPPYGPGWRPARGPLGRLRDRVMRPLVFGTVERKMLPKLNGVRSALGAEPLPGADAIFLRAPLLLYMTAPPFEYARSDWPESVVMVGPCAWEPPAAAPPWLARIERPIVLVTTSSEFQNDGRLVEVALEALADEPVEVIATMPSGDPASFRAPANAHLVKFTPHGPILQRAACAVTHGGMGATQKALAQGVPVCVVPFGRDQLEVARRVEVAGAGTRLPTGKLSAERLRSKVLEAISCKLGAERVASGFDSTGGAAAGADAFEARLLGKKPAPSGAP